MTFLRRLPSADSRWSAPLWAVALAAFVSGLVLWALPGLVTGIVALWLFCVAAVALALVLPLPYAVVSPLYMGIVGWLVDMLPLLILVGWSAVVVRWALGLVRARRLPLAGRWWWLPVFLVVWTALGILVITTADFRHFLLLLGIQGVISGVLVLVVDSFKDLRARTQVVSGLALFVVVLSVAVFLQWIGVPVESLQDQAPRRRVEAAYGLDAFPNAIGMIKYARATRSGAGELRRQLDRFAQEHPELPSYEAFRPRFQAFENQLVVRFAGSARAFEDELERVEVELIYDNVGVAPAVTVPRLRSFPRNALTYAGVCVALFPLALFLTWTGRDRRRALGIAAAVACLFGSGFSLARGSWAAILIGVVYLWIDGPLSRRRKLQVAGAFLAAAVVLTATFLVKYRVDPLTGRLGGGASVSTREDLYAETISFLQGKYLLLGYGTEKPRTESGTVREGARYVPRAGTHSTYLNYLFRTGLPGALAVAALYLVSGLHARAAARAKQGDERVFYTMVAMAVASVGAHAVILSLYVEPTYTLTVSLLLGLAIAGSLRLDQSILPWKTDKGS